MIIVKVESEKARLSVILGTQNVNKGGRGHHFKPITVHCVHIQHSATVHGIDRWMGNRGPIFPHLQNTS